MKRILPQEVEQQLKEGRALSIIDVRRDEEVAQGNLLKAKLNNTALYERNYADTIQYGDTGFESKYFVLLDALKPNSLQPDGYYLMSSSTHSLMQDIDFSDFLGLKTKKGFENLKITLEMELTQNYKVKKEYIMIQWPPYLQQLRQQVKSLRSGLRNLWIL